MYMRKASVPNSYTFVIRKSPQLDKYDLSGVTVSVSGVLIFLQSHRECVNIHETRITGQADTKISSDVEGNFNGLAIPPLAGGVRFHMVLYLV